MILLATGCSDPAKRSVDQLLELMQAAPWTLGTDPTTPELYAIIPTDSALSAYNQIFTYFDPADSTRDLLYRTLPTRLLVEFPVVSVRTRSYSSRGGDTVVATITFDRPSPTALAGALRSVIVHHDSAPPSPEVKLAFTSALKRVRGELLEADTAFIVLHGPARVLSISTASGLRDSARTDSLKADAIAAFSVFTETAHLVVQSYSDYSRASDNLGYPTGGSVQGMVRPTTAPWPHSPNDFYAGLAVECEGSSGARVTRALGYLLPERADSMRSHDFLCLWTGKEALEWQRIRPQRVQVRLRLDVARDSAFGPWVAVH